MRIIAGSAKGTKLRTPSEDTTRPTADRVKESMFSILHFSLPGTRVLDLYAGSGQLGLEALSRGAERAIFVEKRTDVCAIIQENAEKCKLTERCVITSMDAKDFLKKTDEQFDIILLDPPYEGSNVRGLLELLARRKLIAADGIVVVESGEAIQVCEGYIVQKSVKYGGKHVTFFRLKEF